MSDIVLSRVICGPNATEEEKLLKQASIQTRPASLKQYKRSCIKNEDYPAMVYTGQPDDTVKGILCEGLNENDIKALDAFEGDDYLRSPVKVVVDDDLIIDTDAYIYVGDNTLLTFTEWSLTEFVSTGKEGQCTSNSKVYSDTDSDQGTHSSDFHVVPSTAEYEQEDINEKLVIPEDNIKQIEWHPALVLTGQAISKLFSPIFKVLFAPQAQRTFVKSFVVIVLVAWVLLTSFTAYVTFYQRYIPKNAHVEPIYFQYEKDIQPQGYVQFIQSNKHVPLRSDQAYDVSVQLYVPTSDINFNLGNFMIQVELLSQNGSVLAKSSRPTILRYQSNTQRIIHVFSKAIPLLFGWTEESQYINVNLIEGFIEKKNKPMTHARVTLSTHQLQLYEAHLSVVADFRGLRYYMYHKRITTAFVFMILFTVIELICASIAWRSFGKNLWDKLHDVFNAEEEQEHVSVNTSPSTHTNEDEYLTEE
ncbi:hypothetical protein G6F46_000254 [Rhizopus delemar]|uniref:Gamma-glutamylcyclotransferase AIG2-like domain-containing protein n=2 Tax=Rhizopus TaxID=4842 RepID=A0A9P7CUR1_9FUNG|nr:hypothetical protein G6F55_010292 [Rhizopus delemar]KAG1536350.1 hypothetical protein G6F51_011019 [Rhizopus arrhizus]KAG1503929.1 hypothetical protein G6F54_001354 [Rhizopus delemar]KAG1512352.1 hypothetical protein G6F53_005253 [Rhizopus delemar]KAG1520921.1 hypothetical protein G6F52_007213 [Rhizopus delemar]